MDIKPSGPFGCETGLVAVENTYVNSGRLREYGDDLVLNELDLINRIVDIVVDLDPDVLVGWEVQAASWGYLNARGWHYGSLCNGDIRFKLIGSAGFDIGELVSRATSRSSRSAGNDQWGMRNTSTFKVVGRHVLNLWRIMRSEQNLNVYSFENVAFHILRRRCARLFHVPFRINLTTCAWQSRQVQRI
jgi:DNA polymerase zeta